MQSSQGVGATLDTIVWNVKRALKIWCKFQLEWLYKLIVEPIRIKRQKVATCSDFMGTMFWYC